ncbi:MAG: hypothetical protein OXC14_01855, partial [Rhodospirillaceae bacterium]|nr:hypothetical protein [Rhodospirillaceae bacterium]
MVGRAWFAAATYRLASLAEIAGALKSEGEGLEEKLASMHRERSDSTPLGRTPEPEDVANMA